MNGVHDMGGMHGFGPVPVEDHGAFHDDWCRRVFGTSMLVLAQGLYNLDEFRHARERLPPVDYVSKTYFEQWVKGMELLNDGPDADAFKVSRDKSFVSCHWLRHNRNTRIKKEHGPVAAQQYMGHKDSDMTDHYTHFDPEEVQGIMGDGE